MPLTMTKKELIQRLSEFPDDYEIFVKPNRPSVYKSEWKQPLTTTNIVIEANDTFKRIDLR